MSAATVTASTIVEGLRKIGVGEGDTIMVHSSLSAFGRVEGGADAVIEALIEAVGRKGAVVMPAFSNNRADVEKTVEDEALGVSFKFRVLEFNPERDSCWTGKIADTFWRRSDVVRSKDPAYSFAATGPRAPELVRNLEQYAGIDCTIVLFGVGLSVCSAMRLGRQEANLPADLLERITPPAWLKEKYDRENIIFGFGPYADYSLMEKPAREQGIFKETTIGAASVIAFRLRSMLDAFKADLERDPYPFFSRDWISPRYEHLARKKS